LDEVVDDLYKLFHDVDVNVPDDATRFEVGCYFETMSTYEALTDVLQMVTKDHQQLTVTWYLWTTDRSNWSERQEIKCGEVTSRMSWEGEFDSEKQEMLYQTECNPTPKQLKRKLRKLIDRTVATINNDVLDDPESFAANAPSLCLAILGIINGNEIADLDDCLPPLVEPLRKVLEIAGLSSFVDDTMPIQELYAKAEAAAMGVVRTEAS
jgi:hypothetical protein